MRLEMRCDSVSAGEGGTTQCEYTRTTHKDLKRRGRGRGHMGMAVATAHGRAGQSSFLKV
jgi:hypothetical protein